MQPTLLSGRTIFKHRAHAPYQVLRYLDPDLMVDVGAATGYMTTTMLRMSPQSRVHAFEPFPGNHRFFTDHVAGDPRVTFDPRAVCDEDGQATFSVPSVVAGSEPGWENHAGYSSLGMLVSQPRGQNNFTVNTCRLDSVFDEHIRFLKIDTQGAEAKVLKGCERLLAEGKIDILHVEFMGEPDVVDYLSDRDFVFIDTECTIINSRNADLEAWEIVRSSSLSTGRTVLVAWPRQQFSQLSAYADFLRTERHRLGSVWSDLLCVSRSFLPHFMFAAGQVDAEFGPAYAISIRDKLDAA